jgi:fumarylacetoacetate (FAA) hydrolase
MLPQWYEVPVFYFSNPVAIIGDGDPVTRRRAVPPSTTSWNWPRRRQGGPRPAGRRLGAGLPRRVHHHERLERPRPPACRDGRGPWAEQEQGLRHVTRAPASCRFDELQDRYRDGRLHLEMAATVNGKEYSRGNGGTMYWTWPQLLAHASRDTELRPGDVIGSGTVGTGCILELTPEAVGGWLKPGDVVELTVERIGTLRNRVIERPT